MGGNFSKGVSPLLASVLLLASLISIAALSAPMFSDVVIQSQGDTDEEAKDVLKSTEVKLSIESVKYDPSSGNYTVTVHNTGTKSVANLTATVFGEKPVQKRLNIELGPGRINTFTIATDNETSKTELKVSADNIPVKAVEDLDSGVTYVSDDSGGKESGTSPSAAFSYSPSLPLIGRSVSFNGSESTDSDGNISSYSWDWTNDGSNEASGKTQTHSFSSKGEFQVDLTVTDNDGLKGSKIKNILVVKNDASYTSIETFEFGLGAWDIHASCFEQKTGRVYNGSYSGGCNTGSVQQLVASRNISNGDRLTNITFYYNEDTNSNGGGIRFKNSNGNYEIGFATDNPEWQLDDGTGHTQLGEGSYDTWQRVTLDLHWDTGTYDYIINDPTGDTVGGTRQLENGVDISEIEVQNYGGGWGTGDLYIWFDDIEWSNRTQAIMDAPDHAAVEDQREFSAEESIGMPNKSYEWDFDSDGTTDATGKKSNHTYNSKGNFTASLTVEGGNEDVDRTTKQIEVKPKHYEYTDSFEDGSLSDWETEIDLSRSVKIRSDRAYNGGYSVGEERGSMSQQLGHDIIYKDGDRPSSFSFYLQEDSSSSGSGVRLKNSDGNYEASFATDNPEWMLSDSNGMEQVFSGSGYNDWIYIQLRFHWDDGNYSYYVENLADNRKRKGTKSLKHGKDIESVHIENFGGSWYGSEDFYSWMDDLHADMDPDAEIQVPEETLTTEDILFNGSRSVTRGTSISYNWDLDNDNNTEKTGETVEKQFGTAGNHNVSLTVKGPDGKTSTVEKTIEILEGFRETFEDAEMEGWDVSQFGYGTTSRSYKGSYGSGYQGSAGRVLAQRKVYSQGAHPDSLNWSYYETGSSSGGGIRLINSKGGYELGIATDNPEWEITDADGQRVVRDPADDYNHWVHVNVTFNWEKGTYNYSINDPSLGISESGTGEMKQGFNIQKISVENYDGGWSSSSFETWFDHFFADRGGTIARIESDHDTDIDESLEFDGRGSSVASAQPDQYQWDFQGDGTFDKQGAVVEHSYSSVGDYKAKLKITGSDGNTDTETYDVEVHDYDESFDDGDMENWTKHYSGMSVRTDRTYSAPYSMGEAQNSVGDQLLAETNLFEEGSKPAMISYYFTETETSSGGGIRLKNSNGNYEVGVATDNPGWEIRDGSGFDQVFSGSGYQDWIYVKLFFHWDDGTYSYFIKDMSDKHVRNGTRELRYGKDIENLTVENYGNDWVGNEDFYFWIDRIHVDTRPEPVIDVSREVQTGFNVTFNGSRSGARGTPQAYNWDIDGDGTYEKSGEVVYNVYDTVGSRQITLNLEGANGNKANATVQIEVTDSFNDTFEDGNTWGWTLHEYLFGLDTTAYQSDYSIGESDGSADKLLGSKTVMQDGGHPSKASWLFYEKSGSSGGGIRFVNSRGEYEMGIATDNPEWYVSDGEGITQIYNGDGYNRWINVSLDFHWDNSSYSYRIEDLSSGTVRTGIRDMRNGWNIEKMHIENFGGGWTSNGFEMWFDNIKVEKGEPHARFNSPEDEYVGEDAEFDAAPASNGRVDPETYRWDFQTDGSWDANGQKVTHSYPSKGVYNVTLQVEDSTGQKDNYSKNITIYERQFFDSFESGNMDNWTKHYSSYGTRTDEVYDGSYSVGLMENTQRRLAEIQAIPGGGKPDVLRFRYREVSSSGGGGIRLKNSNGNYEVGVATDNPGWEVTDGTGNTQLYGGSNYKDWHFVELNFNWSADTYSYYWENLDTGTTVSGTRNLRNGVGVENVSIENFGGGWGSSDYNMWKDRIELLRK